MRKILKVDSPNDYARFVDAPVLHPLISIIHYDELAPFRHSLNNYGVYGLFIQRQFPFNLSYGMRKLQVSDGSIIAVEPGQIGGLEDNGEHISLCGWVLLWSATSSSRISSMVRCAWSLMNGFASRSCLPRCDKSCRHMRTPLHSEVYCWVICA